MTSTESVRILLVLIIRH